MEKKIARFNIQDMLPIALTLVVTGIGIAYGLNVMGDMRDDFVAEETLTASCNNSLNGGTGSVYTGCGSSYNASEDAISGVAKLPEKMPIIVNVIVAAIIIGILVRYLMVKFG